MKLIASDLIKIFNGNMRWQATELNIQDASIISSGIHLIRVSNEKFLADLGDIIRENLKKATTNDLVLLTKGAFYMRKFKHTSDLYSLVHAACISKSNLREFTDQELDLLSKIYTQQAVFSDSPFVALGAIGKQGN